ncbi:unnamed protein product, partial [Gulo gulo]
RNFKTAPKRDPPQTASFGRSHLFSGHQDFFLPRGPPGALPRGPLTSAWKGGWVRQQGLQDPFPAWPRVPAVPGHSAFPPSPRRIFPGWGFWDALAAPAWRFQARPRVVPVPPPLPRPWKVAVAPQAWGSPAIAGWGSSGMGQDFPGSSDRSPSQEGRGPGGLRRGGSATALTGTPARGRLADSGEARGAR